MLLTKRDYYLAAFAGLAGALLSLPIFSNISLHQYVEPLIETEFIAAVIWIVVMILGHVFVLWLGEKGVFKMFNSIRFAKYLIVGVLNTMLSIGLINIFVIVTGVSTGHLVAVFALISFVITVIHSYLWNKYWTFQTKTRLMRDEVTRFFLVSTGVAILAALFIDVLVVTFRPETIGPEVWANISTLLALPISLFGNYLGYKYLVFKPKEAIEEATIVENDQVG